MGDSEVCVLKTAESDGGKANRAGELDSACLMAIVSTLVGSSSCLAPWLIPQYLYWLDKPALLFKMLKPAQEPARQEGMLQFLFQPPRVPEFDLVERDSMEVDIGEVCILEFDSLERIAREFAIRERDILPVAVFDQHILQIRSW